MDIDSNKGRYPINRYSPATFVCMYQVWNWISNVICHGIFVLSEFS